MKNRKINAVVLFIGLLLAIIGLYLVKTNVNPEGIMKALPYICIGIGCGLFGHEVGNIISNKAIQSDTKAQKKLEIEKNDERNIAIENRAKGKAFDIMTVVFGALMLSFALMGIDLIAVFLLVFAYLFVQGLSIYYRCKFDKEM